MMIQYTWLAGWLALLHNDHFGLGGPGTIYTPHWLSASAHHITNTVYHTLVSSAA